MSENSEDDDDAMEEALFRIGNQTVKKNRVLNSSKKIQKSDFNVYDFLLGWRKTFKQFTKPEDTKTFKVISAKDVKDVKLDDHAQNVQAIYMNIDWKNENSLNGKTVDDLKNINLSTKLINNGILFIWSEKELINDIITILEQKNFIYIENFAVILLNPKLKDNSDPANQANKENAPPKSAKMQNSKITSFFKVQPKKEVVLPANSMQEETPIKSNDLKQCLKTLEDYSLLQEIDPIQLLDNRKAEFFYKSKKILLMFRRNEKNSQPLELRHQRTSDVVFDLANDEIKWKINEYVYKMIETLLPKAHYETNNTNNENESKFKMMEIYGNPNQPRKGWISICESL